MHVWRKIRSHENSPETHLLNRHEMHFINIFIIYHLFSPTKNWKSSPDTPPLVFQIFFDKGGGYLECYLVICAQNAWDWKVVQTTKKSYKTKGFHLSNHPRFISMWQTFHLSFAFENKVCDQVILWNIVRIVIDSVYQIIRPTCPISFWKGRS